MPLGLTASDLAHPAASPAEIALGKLLFFDPVLSSDRSISCSSCHLPEYGFADRTPQSKGVGGRLTLRNTPTILDRALGQAFMWDGKAATLEEQVLLPIRNELEMDLSLQEAFARLKNSDSYLSSFGNVYSEGPNEELLARALAAFVRSKLHGDSRVDRFRAGEHDALTVEERGGLWLFESKAGC